jgi:FixJ family two-component response regulator
MNKPPAVVFVVDDDADVCRALQRALRAGAYETRAYVSPTDFLMSHDPALAGCVVLDLVMPEMDGLEVQACLAARGCQRPVIFMSGHGSIATSVAAMRAGAVTFLTKPVGRRELFAAVDEGLRIDAVRRSRYLLQQEIAERLATLTPRERQVLAHVVVGRLNKQIAAELGTVEKTIKVHRARVMQKMGVRTLAQLVRVAGFMSVIGVPAEASPGTARTEFFGSRALSDRCGLQSMIENDRPSLADLPIDRCSNLSGWTELSTFDAYGCESIDAAVRCERSLRTPDRP